MKIKILLSLILLVVLMACKKDQFNTEPTLTFKSAGEKTVPNGGSLKITFEITDKEGDISNTFFIKKTLMNRRPVAVGDGLDRDSLFYTIPEAPDTRKILLDANLTYDQLISTRRAEPDTILFQFYIIDKAGNKSNIVDVDNVIIRK